MKNQRFVEETAALFRTIISANYSERELREFVQCCYLLALPLIQKKIAFGKLKLDLLGMRESDVVYDCLADLFQRDRTGHFIRIEQYAFRLDSPLSPAETLTALRRLVFGAVNNHITRLYSGVDPALGKILRNMKLALERSDLFRTTTIFGESHLVIQNVDPQKDRPPYPFEDLLLDMSRHVHLNDSIPAIFYKLHAVLMGQDRFQRIVPLVAVALQIKELYSLGRDQNEETEDSEERLQEESIHGVIRRVCKQVWTGQYDTYVTSGKKSLPQYKAYLQTFTSAVLSHVSAGGNENGSLFRFLNIYLPNTSQDEYEKEHRSVLEYLLRLAKSKIRIELGKEYFRDQGQM